VSAKRSSRLGEDGSVGDREREEPSTPIWEASAVTKQRKTEGTVGGGEDGSVGDREQEVSNTGI
jgi:hypothetical protein